MPRNFLFLGNSEWLHLPLSVAPEARSDEVAPSQIACSRIGILPTLLINFLLLDLGIHDSLFRLRRTEWNRTTDLNLIRVAL
jgi:hypothetical protein